MIIEEMAAPSITDWMSSISTIFAAVVAAPAAVYAAIHTRRAADAGARAATEAANQVKELQILREPRAALMVRIPDQLTGEHQIKYGRGNGQYRTGTPVYLDIWNVGGPTIMVMEVMVVLKGGSDKESLLTPQVLVESGKVASVNIAYRLMHGVSCEKEGFIDFPNGTRAIARLSVKYFWGGGEQVVEIDCNFRFVVMEDTILISVDDRSLFDAAGANYFAAPRHT